MIIGWNSNILLAAHGLEGLLESYHPSYKTEGEDGCSPNGLVILCMF